MGAFGIAFDIIVVGALALPSVLLVIHLFFSDHESTLEKLLNWANGLNQPALIGALLFAMAYPMGSAVSRIAQDFFDDADLHLHINAFGYEYWFRLPIATETNIRTDVYCETEEQIQKLLPVAPSADKTPQSTQSAPQYSPCPDTGGSLGPKTNEVWQKRQGTEDLATRVFRFQEAALLLLGTDDNERLRQFHDQIVVLRGAAFNGMVAFFLCFCWWCVRFNSRLRWTAPVALSLLGITALYNHLIERQPSDPPYMEFTLLVLAASGWYVLWPRAPKAAAVPGEAPTQNGHGTIRLPYLFLAAFLTASSFLGWWSTQVLYDQQVFYSYQALIHNPKPAAPATK
jgi:hypothetical protein